MAIDRDLIEKKLDILKDFIYQIENMSFNKEELGENKDIQQLLAFRLQQGIETAMDIATHIIAGLSLERQETAREIFELLGRKKIITKALAKNMGLACNFRNLVVHGYQKIDFNRLYYDYKSDLNDLREFAKQIHDFLEKVT